MSDSWWVNPRWSACFAARGIHGFEAAWNACAEPADAINRRGDGWALVHRLELPNAPGNCRAVYLKQQRNYRTRTLCHPWSGEPVVARELRNLRAFAASGLPAPEPVCFGMRGTGAERDALLATAELDGYVDLGRAMQDAAGNEALRAELAGGAGRLIRRLHDLRWEFRCLYPKHVFVQVVPGRPVVFSFIDLEKARRRVRARYGAVRDLASFVRRCTDWQAPDWEAFYRGYHGADVRPEVVERLLAQVRARRARRD